jgi:hypothetical protein
MTKTKLFRNQDLQERFDKDGYVKISLLSEKVVDLLADLCQHHFPEEKDDFFSSSYLNDLDRKIEISNAIKNLLLPELKDSFLNYRLIGGAFLIKGKGPKSEMPMHQDWTIVDEEQYLAVNVWIPLTETDLNNGTVEVVPGSHRWKKTLRAPTLPFPFHGHQEKIKKYLKPIPTSKGEVIVINQSLIHYSRPNMSDAIRPAIAACLVSEEASLRLYYKVPEQDKLEVFEQEDDFLLHFENFHESVFERPRLGKSTGTVDYTFVQLNDTEMRTLMGEEVLDTEVEPAPIKTKKSFFQRLFGA